LASEDIGSTLARRWINLQAEVLRRMPPTGAVMLGNLRHIPRYLQWYLHPRGRASAIASVGHLEGAYHGCRCIVMGNGPSIRSMNLGALREEFTFGLNRIYLLFDELGFHTSFYAAINRFVLRQFGEEIRRIEGLKFLNWSYRIPGLEGASVIYLETRPILRPDGKILEGYYAGAGTVTNVALQIAFFLGFSEVILVGVDHRYEVEGTPNRAVMASGEDRSHFSADYFGPGVVWQLPDLEAMERGFRQIGGLYRRHRRAIVDATVDGNLTVFPKVDLYRYLEGSQGMNRAAYGRLRERDAHCDT